MKLRTHRAGIGAVALALAVGTTLLGSAGNATAQSSSPAAAKTVLLAQGEGAAFAMTNATAGNQIVRYRRSADGSLRRVGTTNTRGLGIGVDLDTQGPLRLSQDHRFLYAVNAGSDSVSVFAVDGTDLTLKETVYAGDQPVSLTLHDDLLYVLDGSVASNSIRGFSIGANGRLSPITGSVQPLSSPIAVPGDIEFSPDGSTILVTEKTTALTLKPSIALDAFAVDKNGVAGVAKRNQSAGIRPFALAFRNDKQVVVAESFDASAGRSAVSSYALKGGTLQANSTSVANHQTDTCWIVVTHDGRYAYTANFGSGTISSYALGDDGTVTLRQGTAASLGLSSQPVDLAQTADSHFLYLLMRGKGGVAQFRIGDDGALTRVGVAIGGLPVADGASGLAAY